jgi:hypothetical protein
MPIGSSVAWMALRNMNSIMHCLQVISKKIACR